MMPPIVGLVIICASLLGGCVSTKSNEEKILGRWLGTVPGTVQTATFTFYSNGNFSIIANTQTVWGTYAMTDKTLAMQSGGESHTGEYSFSNNDNKLTLIEPGGTGTYVILTRQYTEITNPLQSDRDKLVGTWAITANGTTFTMIFFTDGIITVNVNGTINSGTYEIKDGKFVFTSQQSAMETYDYSFSSDGKELTLQQIDGDFVITLTKQ